MAGVGGRVRCGPRGHVQAVAEGTWATTSPERPPARSASVALRVAASHLPARLRGSPLDLHLLQAPSPPQRGLGGELGPAPSLDLALGSGQRRAEGGGRALLPPSDGAGW